MTTFFDLNEIICKEQLLTMLDWSETSMWDQIKVKNDPFCWHRGVHYFQASPKGKLTFNKRMITVWLTAKSQNDPQMHLNAITLYQQLIPGVATTRRGKNAV